MLSKSALQLMLMLAAWSGVQPGFAAVFAVNDSGTYVEPIARSAWRADQRGQRQSPLLDAATRVHVNLDVQAWKGQTARLYLIMGRSIAPNINVAWTTNGHLQSGRLAPGQRTLVYSGTIQSATLQDVLHMQIVTDSREFASALNVPFSFEIETP